MESHPTCRKSQETGTVSARLECFPFIKIIYTLLANYIQSASVLSICFRSSALDPARTLVGGHHPLQSHYWGYCHLEAREANLGTPPVGTSPQAPLGCQVRTPSLLSNKLPLVLFATGMDSQPNRRSLPILEHHLGTCALKHKAAALAYGNEVPHPGLGLCCRALAQVTA